MCCCRWSSVLRLQSIMGGAVASARGSGHALCAASRMCHSLTSLSYAAFELYSDNYRWGCTFHVTRLTLMTLTDEYVCCCMSFACCVVSPPQQAMHCHVDVALPLHPLFTSLLCCCTHMCCRLHRRLCASIVLRSRAGRRTRSEEHWEHRRG